MTRKFDVVIIGTGAAASAVAGRCRSAGWRAAIIDSRPFGGTCALRGCDPKKVLVGAAEALDWVRRMTGNGIRAERLRIDWPELMRFKRSFTEPVPKEREEAFAENDIEAFHGRARFVGPSAVQVNDDILEGRYIVIAAGQKPADLKIPGTGLLTTSEQFLERNEIPRQILFVGGGYIAFELAHLAIRSGAKVTIVHRGARPLPRFDPDLVDELVESTRQLGADLHLGTEVVGVENGPAGLVVLTSAAGQRRTFEADMAVHAAGRVPEIDDMNLDKAGVSWDPQGVKVNEFLQSVSNAAVYAAGDASDSGAPKLTPVASYEGIVVASNLLKGNQQKPNYVGIPTVTFAIPPLAAVGLNESEARKHKLRFKVNKGMTAQWYSSRRIAEMYSGFKVLVEENTDRILGAHLLGNGAEEVINLFGVAMRSGMRATDLKHALYAYPTRGADVPYML